LINDTIYSDSERFEKLVNCDFSFTKRYGHEKIEEKYASMIMAQRNARFLRSKNNDLFSSFAEEFKNEHLGLRFDHKLDS
jgi:hypothetical protein